MLVRSADVRKRYREDDVALDAIIVPSARPADYLHDAVRLAGQVGCWILVLCSRDAQIDEVIDVFETQQVSRAVAVEVRSDYSHKLFEFATSSPSITGHAVHEKSDLSLKRNIGLAVSRLLGWHGILFLDDDIRSLEVESLRRAMRLLNVFDRVGFRVKDYPDNSVICHAHRDYGGYQDVFVGGSALVVDCRSELAFFPHVYNEDWFFLYDSVRRGEIGLAGDAQQLPYDPYANPGRAESEEFGDAIAEGLLGRLHHPDIASIPPQEYWDDFLKARRRFIADVLHRVEIAGADRVHRAVEAASEVLKTLTAEHCGRFVAIWREDIDLWCKRLSELEVHESLESALKELGLSAAFPCPPNSRLAPRAATSSRQDVTIRVIDDASVLRGLRLKALRTSADAFAADFDLEAAQDKTDEVYWGRILRSARWYAAYAHDTEIGVAAVIQEPGRPPWERHMQSMWVDPDYRGVGVGRRLVHAIARDAVEVGARLLTLWVFVLNTSARDFYIGLGFQSMAQIQALADDRFSRREERLGVCLR